MHHRKEFILWLFYCTKCKKNDTIGNDYKHKLNFDLKDRSSVLRPSDRMLVKNADVRGKFVGDTRPFVDPYIVTDKPNVEAPVCKVKRETRFLHRNFLLPFSMCLPCFDGDNGANAS